MQTLKVCMLEKSQQGAVLTVCLSAAASTMQTATPSTLSGCQGSDTPTASFDHLVHLFSLSTQTNWARSTYEFNMRRQSSPSSSWYQACSAGIGAHRTGRTEEGTHLSCPVTVRYEINTVRPPALLKSLLWAAVWQSSSGPDLLFVFQTKPLLTHRLALQKHTTMKGWSLCK